MDLTPELIASLKKGQNLVVQAINSNGAPLTLDRDNDKNPVVALRELAEDTVTPDDLQENIITTLQRVDERTEAEDEAETVALLAEPQHMNMAEAELIRALQSDRDGGQEERY